MAVEFIKDEFVKEVVGEYPQPLTELGNFVYYRTYSRWLPEKNRREYWYETCKRSVNYNVGLAYKHLKKIGFKPSIKTLREEAKSLFTNMYQTKQFLSGRTLWVGGADGNLCEKYPMSNYNCSFLNIEKHEDLVDLFYNLMIGIGVGFKCTKEMAKQLPPIRINTTLLSSEYNPLPKEQRLEDSKLVVLDNGFAKIYVGDSKEGWCSALRLYLEILTKKEYEDIHTIKINYNSVRPKGERLLTFGGSASGHTSLLKMFEGFDKILKNKIDPYLDPIECDEKGYGQLRPIHILDMGNLIGANVVIGGVRRTAEIFLFDKDDYECLFAKYGINGIWTEDQLSHHIELGALLGDLKPEWFDKIQKVGDGRFGLDHRRMSNNSVAFTEKPTRKELHIQFMLLQGEGEPCFINLEEARRRRPNAEGVNPCARSYFGSCKKSDKLLMKGICA